jgi:hypothetical protein
MDFRKRDKLVEGCNWLMVGIAAGWVAYSLAGSLFSPTGSQASSLPPEIVPPAPLPAQTAPVPIRESEDRTTARSNRPPRKPSALPERDPVWGEAPFGVAPEVPVDPLSTLPPGVGPDF